MTAFQPGAFQPNTVQVEGGGAASAYQASWAQMQVPAASGSAYTLTAQTGTFTVTGVNVNLYHADYLSAQTGTFTLSGIAVNLKHGYKLTSQTGTFSLTGIASNLLHGYKAVSQTGTFSLTGQATNLKHGYVDTVLTGTFTVNGQSVNVKHGYVITDATGAFVLTGVNVNLVYTSTTKTLTTQTGTFNVTGQNTNLLHKYVDTTQTGTFTVNGQSVNLEHGYVDTVQTGSFSLTGINVNLVYMPSSNRTLTTETGSFQLTGKDVNLKYSGESHGAGKYTKKKRVVVESEGNLYAFDSEEDAFSWHEAKKAIRKAQNKRKGKPDAQVQTDNNEPIQPPKTPEPIRVDWVANLAQQFREQTAYEDALRQQRFDALIDLYEMLKKKQIDYDHAIRILLLEA